VEVAEAAAAERVVKAVVERARVRVAAVREVMVVVWAAAREAGKAAAWRVVGTEGAGKAAVRPTRTSHHLNWHRTRNSMQLDSDSHAQYTRTNHRRC
jgi:hypothetical protein